MLIPDKCPARTGVQSLKSKYEEKMFKNLLKIYKVTIFEITMQASWDSVDFNLLKPWPRPILGPQKESKV